MNMFFVFEGRGDFLTEQRNEPYSQYGEVSSASKKSAPAPKALSGEWLDQLTEKGGA